MGFFLSSKHGKSSHSCIIKNQVKIAKITQSSVYFPSYHEHSLSTILSCKLVDLEGLKSLVTENVWINKTRTGKIMRLAIGKTHLLSQTKPHMFQ